MTLLLACPMEAVQFKFKTAFGFHLLVRIKKQVASMGRNASAPDKTATECDVSGAGAASERAFIANFLLRNLRTLLLSKRVTAFSAKQNARVSTL